MNGITILIWITIALIGIIAIILVKLHYGDEQIGHDEKSRIPNTKSITGMLSQRKERINSASKNNSLSQKTTPNTKSLYGNQTKRSPDYDVYIVPEERENMQRYEYESANQVYINYDDSVEKFQEPIKQSQMDIMTQNNNEDKTELKDLFTIDELIKESKRKDNEREKESQTIKREEDAELDEIKQSIKQRQESVVEEPLIEEVVSENETIEDLIEEDESSSAIAEAVSEEEAEEETPEEIEIPSTTQNDIEEAIIEEEETPEEIEIPSTSQKDIEEAISSASQESEEEIESISEEDNITEILLNADDDELDIPNEEIKKPTLKTPNKVSKTKDNEKLFESDENKMDLDYRKDLDKITNKITSSKIFQEVREKLTPETVEEIPQEDEETYIRNVNEYDEFEPIINETHVDYEDIHEEDDDQRLRQENTRRIMGMAKNSPEPELAQPIIAEIKEKPARDNIKVTIGNAEFVIKKGDEIIFNHQGETYSSQVYAIKGDDIHVRYRRQNITIKPEDVKKVY